MAKKKKDSGFGITPGQILAIGVILLAFYAISNDKISLPEIKLPTLNFQLDGINSGEDSTQGDDEGTSTQTDLGDWFTSNFGPYIESRSTNCEAFSGTWVSTPDQVGCYDIPVWDHVTMCGTEEILRLKILCLSQSGYFTCDEHEVSCEYR